MKFAPFLLGLFALLLSSTAWSAAKPIPNPPEMKASSYFLIDFQSGRVLAIPADKTIVDVMEEEGCDPMYDCKRGECGVCQATVLEGEPDHRDYYLSDTEKASGKIIQICISRAKSARLVLDL